MSDASLASWTSSRCRRWRPKDSALQRYGAPPNALSAVVVAIISEADRDAFIVSALGARADVAQLAAVCASIRHAATG